MKHVVLRNQEHVEVVDLPVEGAPTAKCEALGNLVLSGRTPDAVSDMLVEVISSAAPPPLSSAPKDTEEWIVRARAQVSDLLTRMTPMRKITEQIRRLSRFMMPAKRKHEKDKRRVLSEQQHETARRRESHEVHHLALLPAGKGVGACRRRIGALLESRAGAEKRVRSLEQPISKGGCGGTRIAFNDEVQSLRSVCQRCVVKQRRCPGIYPPRSKHVGLSTRRRPSPARAQIRIHGGARGRQATIPIRHWLGPLLRREPSFQRVQTLDDAPRLCAPGTLLLPWTLGQEDTRTNRRGGSRPRVREMRSLSVLVSGRTAT